jgi:hypothetical protein
MIPRMSSSALIPWSSSSGRAASIIAITSSAATTVPAMLDSIAPSEVAQAENTAAASPNCIAVAPISTK